ncbi:MAG: PilZ domain-containing protein [Myxococcota bacterium]
MSGERRADPRYGAHFDVRFTRKADAARALNAFSVNFSSGGLCVRTRSEYAVGELLALSLTIEGQLFELEGVVSWTRGEAIGIRFVNLSPSVRAQLEGVSRLLASKHRAES